MRRTPRKPLPPVSCTEVTHNGGHVILRVRVNAGVIMLRHHARDALDVAESITSAVLSARAHAQLCVELGLPSGDALVVALDTATSIADALVCSASRATGVRA